jgi:hypothetical protein
MNEFRAEHAERSHAFVVALPATAAFELFEPEGERRWAAGWSPRYLHPADGRALRGMVFTTAHGGEDTIWTMVRHEPGQGLVEYVRVTPGSRAGRVLVQCAPLDAARTRVNVIYALTGLTEAGNATIRALDEAHYREFIDSWSRAIEAALARGRRG